jgi:Tol biopolymer transport system component
MTHSMTGYLLAGALLAGLATGQRTDSLEVDLQAAIQKEATEGNLRAAMDQYRKIAARAGANRAVAARALVRLGLCQKKLGDQDARRTWEGVVKEYGDQAAAAEARTLLASLGGARSGELTVRKISTRLSAEDPRFLPDGKTFVFSDDAVAEIKLFDLSTGQTRQISKFGGFAVTYSTTPIPSPDGRWIAVNQLLNVGHRYEVWLLRSDGSQARTLLKLPGQERIILLDWSPDGRFLYAQRGPYRRGEPGASREMDYGLIAVADGAWTTLKKEAPRQWSARFSKDGRWIAYSTDEHTRLMAADGSRDTGVGAFPAKMRLVDWSPDGRWLIITGDRSGALSLWRIPIHNGAPAGEPELLRADLGSQRPLAMAPDGALLCQSWETRSEAWVTSLDVAQGKLGPNRTRVTDDPAGLTMFGGWSPDGSRVAALGFNVSAREGRWWVTRPSGGGVEQRMELRAALGNRLRPVWSPDGQKVFVMTPGGREAQHAILDLATGTVKEVDLPQRISLFATPGPDGAFYSSTGNMQPAGARILVYDPASKSEREVYADPGAWIIRGLTPSPDGKRLAFAGTTAGTAKDGQRAPGERFLRVLDLSTGQAIAIAEAHVSWWGPQRQSIAWTPDGAHLVYSTEEFAEGSDRVKTRIWIAPSAGGSSRRMEELDGRAFDLTVSPDGGQFGFTHLTQTADFWLMENVLAGK